jgi:hypothetical protein
VTPAKEAIVRKKSRFNKEQIIGILKQAVDDDGKRYTPSTCNIKREILKIVNGRTNQGPQGLDDSFWLCQ